MKMIKEADKRKKKENWKNAINENTKSWLVLGIVTSFMLSVFAPLEIYFANKTEFWFDIMQILPIVILFFVVSGLILCVLGIFLQKMKYSYCIFGYAFCFMLYFYIQGNYVPRNYGVLDGVDIDWGSYTSYANISIILLIICLVSGVLICFKVKEKIYSIGKVVCVILLLVQIVTLVTLYIQNDLLQNNVSDNKVVTTKDMLNLSEERNVLVFVLDTFDSSVMQDILVSEEWEEYEDIFDGFIYYPNTVGAYPTTKGALPQILTGEWYENNIPYNEYVRESYADNELYDVLEKNNYSVGIYTASGYLDMQSDLIVNLQKGEYKISNQFIFARNLYKLVAFNYMPHQLKKFFYTTSADFDLLKETGSTYSAYSLDVSNFYNTVLEDNMSLVEEQNCFRFYHLEGIHQPYTFDETLNSDADISYNVYDEAFGNFRVLETFFNKMKEENVWDNTVVIIMADHGYTGLSQNPLFMVKNAEESHELAISDKAMSYEYFSELLMSLVEGDTVDENDIEKMAQNNSERRYMYYTWDGDWSKNYLPNMVEYVVIGNAYESNNMIPTWRTYCSDGGQTEVTYELGNSLSFGQEDTAREYCLQGFSGNEGNYTWTDGTNAAMLFFIEETEEDLELSMGYSTYGESQNVRLYLFETEIADFVASGSEERVFLIPNECVKDGIIYLKFELSDARSPLSDGLSSDSRMLGLAMKSLKISVAEE